MRGKLLPQKLKELRKVNNYTQDYVAEVLGVVRQTYSHYETGKRTPDAEALYKLAGLYNISIDDLCILRSTSTETFLTMLPSQQHQATTCQNILSSSTIQRIRRNTCSIRLQKKNCFFILIRFPKKIKKKLLNLPRLKLASHYNDSGLRSPRVFFSTSLRATIT